MPRDRRGISFTPSAAQAQLAELADAYSNKAIGMQEWLAARKPIEARLTVARKQLAKATRTTVLDGNVGADSGLRSGG
jgi:hypothetical protein